MAGSTPAFNPANGPIVTDSRYAERDFVLFLQELITQAARATPIITTFDELPANPYLGQPAGITDSTTQVWGATITGGGALGVIGVWTGVTWTVMGRTA